MLGMVITQAQAETYLHLALDKFAAIIRPLITWPVNANQFGACMSLAYNIGPGAFGHSSVLRLLNLGNLTGAQAAFALWNKADGKVLSGLVARRAAEAALFGSHT